MLCFSCGDSLTIAVNGSVVGIAIDSLGVELSGILELLLCESIRNGLFESLGLASLTLECAIRFCLYSSCLGAVFVRDLVLLQDQIFYAG
jgi:hypothetical protein